jgi:hypothetical protein
MLTISKRVKDQSLKDLLYKYLKLVELEGSFDLKDYCWHENKILSDIILNIYFNIFDEWLEVSIIPRYIVRNNSFISHDKAGVAKDYCFAFETKGAKILFLRYSSNVFIGILGPKEIGFEILNRVEEKFYEIMNSYTRVSNFILTSHSSMFFCYTVKRDSLKGIQITLPIKELVSKLTKLGFLSKKGFPTRNCKMLNYKLSSIIFRYRKIERNLLQQYFFLDNYSYLAKKICHVLKYSCALTICSKMHLKTLRRTFKKYGRHLYVRNGNKVMSLKSGQFL